MELESSLIYSISKSKMLKIACHRQKSILKQDFGRLFVKLLLQICNQHVKGIFYLINHFKIL